MLLMKDIEALFTRKVAEYLADGYIFNTKTMSGSQVDLKKVNPLFASACAISAICCRAVFP